MIVFVNIIVLEVNIILYIYVLYFVLQRRLEVSVYNKFYCVWIIVFIFGKEIIVYLLIFENVVDYLKDLILKEFFVVKIEY